MRVGENTKHVKAPWECQRVGAYGKFSARIEASMSGSESGGKHRFID